VDLRSLAASIAALGLLYPLIVEPDPDQADSYRIVAGERRWRALRLLKIETAPCVIVPMGTEAPAPEILRVVENHQRRNLESLEKAAAIRTLLDSGLPIEVVARSLYVQEIYCMKATSKHQVR
jgi:ParB family chromosome partitioning protein